MEPSAHAAFQAGQGVGVLIVGRRRHHVFYRICLDLVCGVWGVCGVASRTCSMGEAVIVNGRNNTGQ